MVKLLGDSLTAKSLDDNFTDWESDAFGLGYGTGERPILTALKTFLDNCPESGAYDHEVLASELTPVVAWLLINRLGRLDILEYGTSPRYAWLTKEGLALKRFVGSKSIDELYELTAGRDEDYWTCAPDACNCGPNGYEKGRVCVNPFWHRR